MVASSSQILAAFGLASLAAANPLQWPRQVSNGTTPSNSSMAKGWDDIVPSEELNWQPCFDYYLCHKLVVPKDYEDESVGKLIIAFAKEFTNDTDAEDILYNPGGPGGSGIPFIIDGTTSLRNRLGYKYNLVSFDPRGVNNSAPNLDCFPDNPAVRDYYNSQSDAIIPGDNNSIAANFAEAEGWGKWCSNNHEFSSAKYANTMAVVQDMLHYTKLAAKARGEDPEEVKMNYYGVSYGTVIGTTFASVYPDKVGRFILDGVVDNTQWFNGEWRDIPLETDGAVGYFFETCLAAKSDCPFYKNDKSVTAMKERFDAVRADLKANPIAYTDSSSVELPITITDRDLNAYIVWAMYFAVQRFPLLAEHVANLEKRNATSFVNDPNSNEGWVPCSSCSNEDYDTYDENNAFKMITCIDSNGRGQLKNFDEYAALVDYELNLSQYGGTQFSSQGAVTCHAFSIRPPKSQVFDGLKDLSAKTATPILFTRNMWDPVTPAAFKMSKYFEGSAVLTQKAVGHSMGVAASSCIRGYMLEYLDSGKLPEDGTECAVETVPFQVPDEVAKRMVVKGLPKLR